MASGKRAAESLHLYLSKNKLLRPETEVLDRAFHDVGLSRRRYGSNPTAAVRQQPHEMDPGDRAGSFDEVEECFNVKVAAKEAERCLRCYRVMLIVKRQG
jgi:formate dehydrogenase beta subunit